MVNKPFKYLKGNFTMATAQEILGNPYKRTTATYRFKVTHIEGNVVHYHDAAMETNVQELPNDDVRTLEEQYKDQIDNLFIALSINGEFYFTSKLSNNAIWPGFYK